MTSTAPGTSNVLTLASRLSSSRSGASTNASDADRDVDEEDPRPAERVGEDAAEQHAGRGAEAADRAPDAERDVPLAALGEGRREDRERRRRDHRRAEALERARRDQRRLRPGEAGEQRGEREHDEADQEQAPPPEQVGRAPAEQQEAAEDERVRADHPLQVLLREPEVDLDRGQRDVHDRDVQDDHELHARSAAPAPAICVYPKPPLRPIPFAS